MVETPLMHIDVTPTILESCGVKGKSVSTAGVSATLLRGDESKRPTLFGNERGDEPEKYRSFAAATARTNLFRRAGAGSEPSGSRSNELFDIKADPFEENDLAAEKPEVVAELKKQYETWFDDVIKKGFVPPDHRRQREEKPLAAQSAGPPQPRPVAADGLGHWEIEFQKPGRYKLTARSSRT
ncbi:MAG: hypothetical protein U0792_09680 [Gemmataceae bacterium]